MIEDRFLRRPEVEVMTGLSRSTIYRLMSEGDFAPRYRIGRQAIGWKLSEVREWLDLRPKAVRGRLCKIIACLSDYLRKGIHHHAQPDDTEHEHLSYHRETYLSCV